MNFYQWPGFSNYKITELGAVYDVLAEQWLIPFTNSAGYRYYTLKTNIGHRNIFAEHTFVCTIHHGPSPSSKHIVNHKDGNKLNNAPSNLEWVTKQQNAEHAGQLGLSKKCIPVSIRNANTGEILKFPSALKAAIYLSLDKDVVLWRIKQPECRIWPEGFQYRKGHSNRPWANDSTKKYGRAVPILVYNLLTKQELRYSKVTDAANEIKIAVSTIVVELNKKQQRVISGKYLIKRADDLTPWRTINDVLLENNAKKPIIVTSKTGQVKIFASCAECAVAMGIKATTLSERLRKSKPQKFYSDDFNYAYYTTLGPHQK